MYTTSKSPKTGIFGAKITYLRQKSTGYAHTEIEWKLFEIVSASVFTALHGSADQKFWKLNFEPIKR